MRLHSLMAGAALGAAALAAGPALAADMQTMQGQTIQSQAAPGVSPEVRQMHRSMGSTISPDEARAASQVGGPDLLVGEGRRGTTTVVVTQRHAYPELFAAQVDGIASVGSDAARHPVDPMAPVHKPD